MIQFFSTNDLSDHLPQRATVYHLVRKLQAAYGELSCSCHPNYQWATGIELTTNGYKATGVTTDAVKPCTFLSDILDAEIVPYLHQYFQTYCFSV